MSSNMMRQSFILLALSCVPAITHGLVTLSSCQKGRLSDAKRHSPYSSARVGGSLSTLAAVPAIDDASSLLLAQESWRQYIPLGVSAIVIVDILLGSPLLNLIVAPMKRQAEGEDGNETMFQQQPKVNPKERIDSEKVAQEALDKARNSLELRAFLDEQKDPIEEARKALDKQMADLDETLDKKKMQE